jgi:hypothetical protein
LNLCAQELSLVSWRLVLIDLLMMVYLLAVLGATMVMGIDVDVNVVANALFKYVPACAKSTNCRRQVL